MRPARCGWRSRLRVNFTNCLTARFEWTDTASISVPQSTTPGNNNRQHLVRLNVLKTTIAAKGVNWILFTVQYITKNVHEAEFLPLHLVLRDARRSVLCSGFFAYFIRSNWSLPSYPAAYIEIRLGFSLDDADRAPWFDESSRVLRVRTIFLVSNVLLVLALQARVVLAVGSSAPQSLLPI